jgi:succinate dehydrogenase / fumarate reductase cytochrome b subunit
VAMALLAFHLSHGVASLFQTLGVTDQKMRFYYETGGQVLAWGLFVGYIAIPVSVLFFGLGSGVVK